jgi:hypothetical protein
MDEKMQPSNFAQEAIEVALSSTLSDTITGISEYRIEQMRVLKEQKRRILGRLAAKRQQGNNPPVSYAALSVLDSKRRSLSKQLRSLNLVRAFLRGRAYQQVEEKTKTFPDIIEVSSFLGSLFTLDDVANWFEADWQRPALTEQQLARRTAAEAIYRERYKTKLEELLGRDDIPEDDKERLRSQLALY